MKEYYFLANRVTNGAAFAYTEDKDILAHNLIAELKDKVEIPFELSLKKVTEGEKGLLISDDLSTLKYLWMDFQPNNLAWPLMSERLKNIIDKNITGKESIIWMNVKVKYLNEKRMYFLPRFTQMLDVLDMNKTKFVKETNHVIIPHFSLAKIDQFNIFYCPQRLWEIPSGLYVNDIIKNAIEAERLKGIVFEKVSAS